MNDYEALDNYYSVITKVESKFQDYLDAQRQLSWHNNQLQEAKNIASKIGILNTQILPTEDFQFLTESTNSGADSDSALSSAHTKAEEYIELQKQLKNKIAHHQIELKSTKLNLENKLKSTISTLNENLTSTTQEISNSNSEIDRLKTRLMMEALIIIGSGIASAFIFPNIISITFVMLVTWWFRSSV